MAVQALAWGYGLIEGPRVDSDGALYFSDVPNGGVYRRAADGTISVAIPKRRGVGGIALHADGGIVVSGRNIAHVRNGATRILFALDDVGGFNDLFADDQGRLIVGSLRDDPFRLSGERRKGEAYRIEAEGKGVELYGDIGVTNGIGFSPDGRRLYHVDSTVGILVHDVDQKGDVIPSSRAVFARPDKGGADGLAVDQDGGVWIANYGDGCVQRFDAGGTADRRIDIPAQSVTSLCFAGPERDELVVVTADNTADPERKGTVFLVSADEVGARGVPIPLVRI
jgi:gluconolactonase